MKKLGWIAAVSCITVFSTWQAQASTLQFECLFDSAQSGLSASLSTTATTSGTLIGNYDPTENPTGTRTKPGFYGPFGDTENVAVPTSLTLGVGGQPQSSTGGSFRLSVDQLNDTIWLDSLLANLLQSGPVTTTATVTLQYDTFRTRNPSSLFVGGFPIQLPIGQVSITSMILAQQGGPTPGTLTPLGGNQYQFACVIPALLTATAEYLGTPLTLPDIPVVLPFGGQLVLTGNTVQITSVQSIQFADTSNPGTTLPTIPLDVPTILPPGCTASLLFNLTLNEVATSLDGTLTTVATGTLIPEPASLMLLMAGAVVLLRRRRSQM